MYVYIFFAVLMIGAVVVALIIDFRKRRDPSTRPRFIGDIAQDDITKIGKYQTKMKKKKEKRKERILEFLREKGKVANQEIEELLSVSDASATNYLDELEKEGKIKQVGKKGRFVYYELNG